jgi:hypothetical protein
MASSKAATALDQILSLKLCCIRGNGKSFGGKINGDSKSLATSFKLQNVSTAFQNSSYHTSNIYIAYVSDE